MTIKMKLTKRKNQFGEYKIRYYEDGKEIEEGSYYTDDWEDAKNTFKLIAKNLKLETRNYFRVSIFTGRTHGEYLETI